MFLKLVARFLVILAALLLLITWLTVRTDVVSDVEVVTAVAATGLMQGTGLPAARSDVLITVPGRVLQIGPDCTGLTIAAILVALVLAYPVKPSSKLIGIFAGVAVVLVANLVRLVAVAYISPVPDRYFLFAHDFLFQVGMVAVTVGVWVAWLSFARARES